MRYADVFCSKQLFGGAARFQSGVSGDALALRCAAKAPCLMLGVVGGRWGGWGSSAKTFASGSDCTANAKASLLLLLSGAEINLINL